MDGALPSLCSAFSEYLRGSIRGAAPYSHLVPLILMMENLSHIRFKEPEEFLASICGVERQPWERPAEPLSQVQPRRPAQPAHAQGRKTKTPAETYEDRLSKARWLARSVGSFYSLCRFLGICSLTWATVVLLGAFVPYLRFVDYAMVTFLLLLEAIRLATASFFTILLTQRLARRSQDPQAIVHDKDDHYRRTRVARLISTFLQALLIAPSFVCPIIRFPLIQYEPDNLHTSIFIFYLLILINASVSSIALFCSSAAFIYLKDSSDQSMLRYYDKLVQNAISNGVIQASDFGFFQFAYKMLGGEYARLVQPEAVVKNHRKLVEYLYHHRLGQDFLLIYLDADDAFVQQAAVNMVGFWGDPGKKVGLKEVKISKGVLTKMADKVAAGQVGWATVNSFGGLARRDASILAKTKTSSGMPLLDRLVELVLETSGSSSLTFVRALVLFYHFNVVQDKEPYTVPVLRHQGALVQTLKKLLREVKVKRLRIYCAYLLHLMAKLDSSCYSLIEAIHPTTDSYWFSFEQSMLAFLIQEYALILPASSWPLPPGFVRSGD